MRDDRRDGPPDHPRQDPQDERWEATLDRVLELTVVLGRDATSRLARMELTEARAHLLWELRTLGPCTQRALASALGVTPRAITALVDSLVETGFVTREPCPTDRRAILVTFTELGRTTAQELADGHRELARQLFADMPAKTFDGFDTGLGHVVTRLRTVLAGVQPAPPPALRAAMLPGHPRAESPRFGAGSGTGTHPEATHGNTADPPRLRPPDAPSARLAGGGRRR